MLNAYAAAGGRDAALLIHSEGAGERMVNALGRAARLTHGVQPGPKPAAQHGNQPAIHGLPARVLPVPVWHTASVGLDLWLSALALGASQVLVLLTEEEAPEYRQALTEQMAVAQALLTGLGYEGTHLRLVEAGVSGTDSTSGTDTTPDPAALARLDAPLRSAPARTVARPAAFAVQADKRATLELALDHLLAQAPLKASPAPGTAAVAGASGTAVSAAAFGSAAAAQAGAASTALPEAIALPAIGSPFGSLVVDPAKCTLCLSCVGACPESALADNPQQPQLRFTEKNCVQCGLCATTCPEQAITLQPRLWLAEGGKARKAARVLHEAAPFHCVRCAKPFGTLRAIENMIEKLGSHAAFQGAGAERLKMCSDCRVVDMFSNPNEVRITDL
jgi:ferredoxin